MFRQSVSRISRSSGAAVAAAAAKPSSSATLVPRAFAAVGAPSTATSSFSTSSKALVPKGDQAQIDESRKTSYPDLGPKDQGKGPEFIKGDEGSHGQRTLKSFSMNGKVCVVTGGARGLGNLMGRALVESGCDKLAILDLHQDDSSTAAQAMTEWIETEGAVKPGQIDIRGFACDVATESSVQKAFQDVRDVFGRIDTVINSAGIVENYPALEYPTDKLHKLYAINVFGSHYVSREAAKHMVADNVKGSIILIASMSASIVNIPQPQAPYNASKAAVKHLASCLAIEWAKYGIRCNSVSPGYMATSLTQQMFERNEEGRQLKAMWEDLIPMGRMGSPEELKGAAVYLSSDASRYTTGTDLVVDGGYCCT